MKIFIDAMGGDRAPDAVLAGVQLALPALDPKASVVLLGEQTQIEPLMKKYGLLKKTNVEFIHCASTIAMDESPVQAVRQKKDSSIVDGLKRTYATPNSAFFSAGHSGAVFAAALLAMGRIEGVERPAIATALPTLRDPCILLDAGANVDCRPQHLLEFAKMGSVYAQILLQRNASATPRKPKIGLLSNGEEDSKGTDLTRSANELLKAEKDLNYVGYVEGKEIFSGNLDVVITDGFTGNIVLKSIEGLGKSMTQLFKEEFKKSILAQAGAFLLAPVIAGPLRRMQKKLDYAEVGGAPLLGVDGNCFIGHGRSAPKAIKNGILRAQEAIQMQLHDALKASFHQTSPQEVAGK